MREKTVKSPGGRTYLCQADREAIIREYYLEGVSKTELARRYGCSFQAVLRNITKFAAENDKSALLMKNKPIDSQAEEIKALKAEVLELKKKLYEETMRADFCDTMIDVAEEMFDIEIRKKADTGRSKGCTEKSNIQ